MMKRYIVASIFLCILIMLNVQPTFAMKINVVVNDYNLIIFPDQKPYIDSNNRVLVPVRFVSEELGAKVQWDSASRQVTITYEGDQIRIEANNSQAVINSGSTERKIDMGTAAVINNDRMMVPLRFISETTGSLVSWVESTQTVFIERKIKNKPDHILLRDFKRLDDQKIHHTVSKKDGYQMLKSWNVNEVIRTSSGEFTDYMTEVSFQELGDTFLFEYDSQRNDNIAWASVYFSTDEDQKNFFYYDISNEIIQNKKHAIINREQFQVGAGSPKWENVKYFRIAFQSKTGSTFNMEPRNLVTYIDGGEAMVTLWFDDGWEDTYTNAYRLVSRIDSTIRGVVPILPTRIGTDRYLSKEQLLMLRNAGWELTNHSYSHPNLTELADDEIRDEVLRAYSFISEYDPIGAYHFAVPYSAVDDRVLEILKESTLSIRHLGETIDYVPFDRFNLGYKEVTNLTSFETVRSWIDEAIENKQWLGLMFHRIEDPAIDRYSYGTQEFEKIIYYLSFKKNEIKTVTVTDAFREAGLPIYNLPLEFK